MNTTFTKIKAFKLSTFHIFCTGNESMKVTTKLLCLLGLVSTIAYNDVLHHHILQLDILDEQVRLSLNK